MFDETHIEEILGKTIALIRGDPVIKKMMAVERAQRLKLVNSEIFHRGRRRQYYQRVEPSEDRRVRSPYGRKFRELTIQQMRETAFA